MLFMPTIAVLSSVFICYETSGDDVDDAFMDKDCYETCWSGEHLTYVIFAAIAIFVYEPLSIYMRPKWQEMQLDLNVITQPVYMMFKSIF
jgi:hypothetical protein